MSTILKAGAVAGVFATAFKHVDKNAPFASEAEFVAALRTAANKVPASEQDSLRFSHENLEEGEAIEAREREAEREREHKRNLLSHQRTELVAAASASRASALGRRSTVVAGAGQKSPNPLEC